MADIRDLIRKRCGEGGLDSMETADFLRRFEHWRAHDRFAAPRGEVSAPHPSDVLDRVSLGDLGQTPSLEAVAWIVLNGGLGTTMRMARAKGLLPVRGEKSFLDLLSAHVVALREGKGQGPALLFMNSFATHADTLRAVARYPLAVEGKGGGRLPIDFLQGRIPRLRESDGAPVGQASDDTTWAPPGHGDLYGALWRSGVLDRLIAGGYRYAFVSNVDNLGATPLPAIAAYMAAAGKEFVMEVVRRDEADVKGGGPVRLDGRLALVETSQLEAHEGAGEEPLPYFNTNNLWIDLGALRARMSEGGVDLPLIVNPKIVGGERVVQLETAAGAALGVFDRVGLVSVGRERFAPVKGVGDLLARRSDLYREGPGAPLVPAPERDPAMGEVLIDLDPATYGSVEDLDFRIPEPPGLLAARSLTLRGDVRFGRGVTVVGDARIVAPPGECIVIDDGARIEGE